MERLGSYPILRRRVACEEELASEQTFGDIVLLHCSKPQDNFRRRLPLVLTTTLTPERAADLVALDEALSELGTHSQQKSRVVELRHFLGLTFDEVAKVMGLSSRTVKRHWNSAKAWLHHSISKGTPHEA